MPNPFFLGLGPYFFSLQFSFGSSFRVLHPALQKASRKHSGLAFFFVLAAPYIGIPFFILLADRKYKTRFQKKKSLYQPNPHEAAHWEGAVEKLLAGLGVPPPRSGQKAKLISSGEEAYQKIVETYPIRQSANPFDDFYIQ